MTEFGVVMEPSPHYTARLAARIESMGFDILMCPDTQNLGADPYGQLCLAAAQTKRLRMGTGVTNAVTRASAVTASAVASLQMESDGRALCGIGRGDSSAAHIGRRSATTAELRDYIEEIKTYLRGGEVMIDGKSSTMRWIDPKEIPPAPVDVACTGPKTIQMAADVADRISFAVGSVPGRIRWALDTAHEQLEKNGRNRSDVSIGAYLNVVCDENKARAIKLGRTIAGLVAHFAGMKDAPVDHLPPQLKPLAIKLKTQYDMKHHAQETGSHLEMVDNDFVDWFSICAPPQECLDRVGALIEQGLDHVYLLGGSTVAHPHGARQESMVEQTALFASEVMPQLRAA